MKLTLMLTLALTWQVNALAFSQKVTISVREEPLENVIQEIRRQTGYAFFFDAAYLRQAHPVTLELTAVPVEDALEQLFKLQPVNFSIDNRIITIKPRPDGAIRRVQKSVQGIVTDSTGVPLTGVTVMIKGESTGTSTELDGSYVLPAESDAVLVFSLLGFTTREVPVDGRERIDVILQVETSELEELVVVGYGMQKKESLTGAVSAIKGSDLVGTKNESVVNMLSGRIPGVRVVQSSGEPGAFASGIQIRGFGAPLVIIDGVPRNNLARLDVHEIESISVLKDASAAIYGVRASNGVILVTTKKGAGKKTSLDYSTYFGFQTPINTPRGLDAVQFMEITNENNIMRGSVAPGTLVYSPEQIEKYRSGQRTGTEWYRINTNFYAPQYQHNVQLSGGAETMDYFVNFSYFDQQGLYKNGDINYDRYNFRANLNADITKGIRAELKINGMTDSRNRPYEESINFWKAAWTYTPVTPAYANYDPRYMQNTEQGFNPLAITDSDLTGYRRDNQKLFQSTGNLIWDVGPVPGLQARASYSYDFTFWENKSLQKPYYLYDYDLNNDVYIPKLYGNPSAGESSSINRNTNFGKNTLLQFALSYDKTIADHQISLLALYEEGSTDMDNFYAAGYIGMTSIEELLGATNESLTGGMNASSYSQGANNGLWEIANKAFVGRANYNYKGKYYGEIAFRYDGSSKFAPGKRWGFFPSVSGAWRVSEESFLKESDALSFLDNLKIRASYGITGDDITATFQFVPGFEYPGANIDWWPIFMDGVARETINLKATPNTNLTWYESEIFNVGLDADLWNGVLGFELDVFRRNRHGLMATRTGTIPDWIGEGLAQENLNSDRTQGFDLLTRHRNTIAGKLNYEVAANVSFTRHQYRHVTRVPSDNRYSDWRSNSTNRWSDVWWGYSSEGSFQNYQEIWDHAIYTADNAGNSELKPGDYKYLDWNEDGVIDDKDVHPIMGGNYGQQSTPKLSYGMSLFAEYQGFDLSVVFQGGAMGTIMYDWILARPFISDQSGPDFFYDRWHMKDPLADPKDPRTEWVPGTLPTTSQGSQAMGFNASTSNSTVHRTDYLRCKSLEIGYTLPGKILDWAGIKNVRVFGSAYNLFTLTGLKYLDPEHPSSAYGLVYPLIRTINFGASVKL
ncbi:MAG TPA: TonB-dependent receptor [Anseongella sp.]